MGEQPGAAEGERVEKPDLDPGMIGQCGPDRVEPGGAIAAVQGSYPHAPVGSGAQLVQQQPAGRVGLPDARLHIDRDLRRARQQHPSCQSVPPINQRDDATSPQMPPRQRQQRLPQEGRRAGLNGDTVVDAAPVRQRMQQPQHDQSEHRQTDSRLQHPGSDHPQPPCATQAQTVAPPVGAIHRPTCRSRPKQ